MKQKAIFLWCDCIRGPDLGPLNKLLDDGWTVALVEVFPTQGSSSYALIILEKE